MNRIKAWLGFVHDVGKILLFREWGDEPTQHDEPMTDEKNITPVVKISPTASSMIANASKPKQRHEQAPLDGSIEARRTALESR